MKTPSTQKCVSLFLLLFALGTFSFAQTTITAANILDPTQQTPTTLATGQLCFNSTCWTVTSGAIPGGETVTSNETYNVTVQKSGGSVVYLTVPNVAVGAGTMSWDSYTLLSTAAASGLGAPYKACNAAAQYVQTDGGEIWRCLSVNGSGVWQAHDAIPSTGMYLPASAIPWATPAVDIGSATPVNGTFLNGTFSGDLMVGATTIVGKGEGVNVAGYGAVCNGSNDDTMAFDAALGAIGPSGGVLKVPNNCVIANPQNIVWPGFTGTLKWEQTGKLTVDSTFKLPDWVDIVGQGGANGVQFAGSGPTALIQGPTTIGTLGTAVTAGSQTFTPSTMTNIHDGTVLFVVGERSCTPTGYTRTAGIVTATFSAACYTPPGYDVTIAGATDSTYDGTFLVIASDYPAMTLTWNQCPTWPTNACPGGLPANGTTTAGTVTGVDETTLDLVQVSATTGTTATATFLNAHPSTDQWGIDTLLVQNTYQHHTLEGITVAGGGPAIVLWDAALVNLRDVSAQALSITQMPLIMCETFWDTVENSAFLSDWGVNSFSVWITNINHSTSNSSGMLWFENSNIMAGIKADRGTIYGLGPLHLSHTVVEQTTRGAVVIDAAGNLNRGVFVDDVLLQDNFFGYSPCVIASPSSVTTGTFELSGFDTAGGNCVANKYYNGGVIVNGAQMGNIFAGNNYAPRGTAQDGKSFIGEFRSANAGFAPSLIPYATLNMPSSPASWSSMGSATITTGVKGPGGQASAATISGGSGNPAAQPGLVIGSGGGPATPAVGDWILYGGWTNQNAATNNGEPGLFWLRLNGAGNGLVLSNSGDPNFASYQNGEGWFPVAAAAKVLTAPSSGIYLGLDLNSNGGSYAYPWAIYIPASAGFSDAEIMRWREQLLHGIVPPSATAGTLATGLPLVLPAGSTAVTQTTGDNTTDVATDAFVNASVPITAIKNNGTTVTPSSGAVNLVPGTNVTLTTSGNAVTIAASVGSTFPTMVATLAPTTYSGTTSQSASWYTPASAGFFRVCAYVSMTVAGSAGAWQAFAQYTQDGHGYNSATLANVSTSTQWNSGGGCTAFYSDASHAISWYLSSSGVTGTPTVRYAFTLEQLE